MSARTSKARAVVLLVVSVVLGAVGLVAVAAMPTGSATVEGAVPSGARVAAQSTVEDNVVLLVVDRGRLRVVVAWRDGKGWLSAVADAAPSGTHVAWTATGGHGPVPAFSAAYGRGAGVDVRVDWADGQVTIVRAAADGSWISAHPGRVRATRITFLDERGAVISEDAGP